MFELLITYLLEGIRLGGGQLYSTKSRPLKTSSNPMHPRNLIRMAHSRLTSSYHEPVDAKGTFPVNIQISRADR